MDNVIHGFSDPSQAILGVLWDLTPSFFFSRFFFGFVPSQGGGLGLPGLFGEETRSARDVFWGIERVSLDGRWCLNRSCRWVILLAEARFEFLFVLQLESANLSPSTLCCSS